MALFALIDSDNFYVSVERIFDSTIHDRPVIVLSSGDGCVIARSNEAKDLGIVMGAPVFRYRRLIEEKHIAIFSSNFQLYQDISDRIAAILATFSEQPPERYSIDECFLSLNHVAPGEAETVGREIRARILQFVGVPCSVGVNFGIPWAESVQVCERGRTHPSREEKPCFGFVSASREM